jgi:hypothetical protein
MDFIFMLTHDDRTVEDAPAVLDEALALGLRHVGFKDVGATPPMLRILTDRIRQAGATSYMEVVSPSRDTALYSAAVTADIGIDRLLGGAEVETMLRVLDGTDIECFPFPGFPEGHPTRLGGTPLDIAAHCTRFLKQGCRGADLLAYRATQAEPLELVRAARNALGERGELIVAGSINSFERIRALREAGVDAFTIGSAIFDGSISPQATTLRARLESVIAACAGRAAA